ncbi:site-specific integrase [Hymenobacter sp. J193]|uniref:site-specific integrase n=1 Tax=Hymenobacter sp. J193 TaxID=2898429 RepID=UPI002151E796|nr:site-specific integrase [Hymenobacter sp. J193]MCR5886692.1 site-specific integrase [Hymenobacter sp. J193]
MELVFRIRPERTDKKGRSAITIDIHWAGGRLQLATGEKVQPIHWQPTKSKRVNTKEPDSAKLNLALDSLQTRITKLFTLAEASGQPESSVSANDLRGAVSNSTVPIEVSVVEAPRHDLVSLHAQWKRENAGLAAHTLRRYDQVISHLEKFRAGLTVHQLTRQLVTDYQVHLQQLGLADSTFLNHVKFLREAYRTAGLAAPNYLKFRAPEARPVALRAEEFLQLVHHKFTPSQQGLADERDTFVLQTLVLLRDSDLRRLRPAYVRPLLLQGYAEPVPVVEMPQKKTDEEVAVPLPPLGAAIWEKYAGRLPLVAQQNRNERLKHMAAVVGLNREFVSVRWVGGEMHETATPLSAVMTTHVARHTGADLLLIGSHGDRNLVEVALGHTRYTYGRDSIVRYGPSILDAWMRVLGAICSHEC